MATLLSSSPKASSFLKSDVMRGVLKYAAALCLSMFLLFPVGAQEMDTTSVFKALDTKLSGYVGALEPMGVETQKEECGFLISSCTDSLVRQHVSLYLYSHYVSSDVMGAEAVAIDIADRWLLNGKVLMKNDVDLMNARIFAEFNRSSLVGERAPEVTLSTPEGGDATLFAADREPRLSVIYFYDTGCPDCLVQTVMLRTFLDSERHPLDVYAVYVGADSLSWRTYREKRLSVSSPQVNVLNLWDPDMSSDFQRKFGVLKTPQMLLVGKDNVILGRRLDVPALGVLLRGLWASDDYEYGSEESRKAFGDIFSTFGDDLKADDVEGVVDRIADRTASQPAAFKESVGDLFHYLASMSDGAYKEGAKYLADRYILSRPDIWDSPADTLKVVWYARTMSDLLSRAMPGTPAPHVRVAGTLARGRNAGGPADSGRKKTVLLSRPGKDVYVMFYDEMCGRCRENMDAAAKLMKRDRKMRVLYVKMDSSADMAELLDAFDLTVLPYITHVSGNGMVLERYVDFTHMERNTFGKDGK